MLLVVLLLLVVVSFELRLLTLRGSKGLAVWLSLSSKKKFVKLKLLQSVFGSGHNGLLYGYLGHPCGKCHRVQSNLNNAMC